MVPLLICLLVVPFVCTAAEEKDTDQKRNIQRLYALVGPKFKGYSAAKVPLFTGDSPKRAKKIIQQSNITKYLQPKYKEKEVEETFLQQYRPTNAGTLLIDVINKNGESNDLTTVIKQGIDVNAADSDGNTALHHLLMKKSKRTREKKKKANYSLISQLLQAGANIHAPNKKGQTPLGMAKARKLNEMVEKMEAYTH